MRRLHKSFYEHVHEQEPDEREGFMRWVKILILAFGWIGAWAIISIFF
ncbi:MAG TPA: hypothetical protein VNM69_10080 [Bacillus sp. (in: firmicutes)]|nr:hypothetical protein [Bacillus litorisediminis]HWO76226.1 hypothetical protein [Bacillus sp. (in: firmicutes)]